jgi:hypothetical protein
MFEDAISNDFVDMWVLMSFVFLANAYTFLLEDTRNPAVEQQRINWGEHRDIQIRRGHFRRMYRMSPEAFEMLTEMLRSSLEVNKTKAYARSEAGPILPKIRLHCLIRYLAGGSYLDICALVSMPHSTFYYSLLWKTMDAINDCDALAFVFPPSDEELRQASQGFERTSTQGVMRGCVGAIDGWLCPIIVPPSSVGNVSSFFSGHYQRMGVNVQAVVDHYGRFLYVAVAAPGGQPNVNALARTSLQQLISLLHCHLVILL